MGGLGHVGFIRPSTTPTVPRVKPKPKRPSWDEYFLNLARAVAARADCSRRQVGAVVVRDNRIVSTGYNGSPPGGPSCLAGLCPRATSDVAPGSSYDTGPGACVAVHAEANAVLYAGRDGCSGSTLYVTEVPCDGCRRLIVASGIARIVTPGELRWAEEARMALAAGLIPAVVASNRLPAVTLPPAP